MLKEMYFAALRIFIVRSLMTALKFAYGSRFGLKLSMSGEKKRAAQIIYMIRLWMAPPWKARLDGALHKLI